MPSVTSVLTDGSRNSSSSFRNILTILEVILVVIVLGLLFWEPRVVSNLGGSVNHDDVVVSLRPAGDKPFVTHEQNSVGSAPDPGTAVLDQQYVLEEEHKPPPFALSRAKRNPTGTLSKSELVSAAKVASETQITDEQIAEGKKLGATLVCSLPHLNCQDRLANSNRSWYSAEDAVSLLVLFYLLFNLLVSMYIYAVAFGQFTRVPKRPAHLFVRLANVTPAEDLVYLNVGKTGMPCPGQRAMPRGGTRHQQKWTVENCVAGR